jgi:hypothetical protein
MQRTLTDSILATVRSVENDDARNGDVRAKVDHQPGVGSGTVAPVARVVEDAIGGHPGRRVGPAQVRNNGGDVVAETVKRHHFSQVQHCASREAQFLDKDVPTMRRFVYPDAAESPDNKKSKGAPQSSTWASFTAAGQWSPTKDVSGDAVENRGPRCLVTHLERPSEDAIAFSAPLGHPPSGRLNV